MVWIFYTTLRQLQKWTSIILLLFLLLTHSGAQGGWPEGTYAIPMSKTGCPEVTDFTWEKGSRTHHTEMGSHGSDPSHLAGIYTSKSDRVTQNFCVKVSPFSDKMHTWQKGRYCIMKYRNCPNGFREGWLYWDDAAPWFGDTTQNQSGMLPDGEYNRNTKIKFCCRNDGLPGEGISLPTNSPFHLLRWGDRCQEVEGMTVNEEFVYWKDEPAMNMNTQGGLFPMVLRSKYPEKYTKVFYCYYTQAPPNNNIKTLITIGYVLAGVVGAIFFLLILICIIQRIANIKHKKKYAEHNASNTARERMLLQPSRAAERGDVLPGPRVTIPEQTLLPEPTAQYRPLPEPSVHYRPLPEAAVSFQPGNAASFNPPTSVPYNSQTSVPYNTQTSVPYNPQLSVPYSPPGYTEQDESGAVSDKMKLKLALGEQLPTDGASSSHQVETPSGEEPASLGSIEERTPMLQPPPFTEPNSSLAQPGASTSLPPRPISQPPSYEEVLREDGKMPSLS